MTYNTLGIQIPGESLNINKIELQLHMEVAWQHVRSLIEK